MHISVYATVLNVNRFTFSGGKSAILIFVPLLSGSQIIKRKALHLHVKKISLKSRPIFSRILTSGKTNRKSQQFFPFVKRLNKINEEKNESAPIHLNYIKLNTFL